MQKKINFFFVFPSESIMDEVKVTIFFDRRD